ncbi:MAG: 23S rRNA (adenine(2030)-N(6))-methyltransferase RlmJ [Rubrivivax sp.]
MSRSRPHGRRAVRSAGRSTQQWHHRRRARLPPRLPCRQPRRRPQAPRAGAAAAHLNEKEKGWRYVDTHAGAGGYSLAGSYGQKHREYEAGIGRLVQRGPGASALPQPVQQYVDTVRAFDAARSTGAPAGEALRQYPGSPAIAHAFKRAQDQSRLFELHPTEHKILAGFLGSESGCEVRMADGYSALKSVLPPPTRRGLVLVDPPDELKTDLRRRWAPCARR